MSGVTVLHEDNHVIAVFKPAGLLTQGDSTGDPCLLDLTRAYIKEKYAKPGNVFLGLVHRLDRPAAGIVVFGRTSKAASRLSEQFRTRTVEKIYRAWVEGEPDYPHGTLTHHLVEGEKKVEVHLAPKPGTKVATLEYLVLATMGGITLLEVRLHTGRKHQIRAQLAAIGTPILGDIRYGGKKKDGKPGIGLLAYSLSFDHPTREERIVIKAPDYALERAGLKA